VKFYSLGVENNLWNDTLSLFSNLDKDIFYSQNFANLTQKTIYKNNSVKCLMANNSDNFILCPIIERKFKFKKTSFVDLTSPYNLGGPIFNKKDEKLIEFFNKQLINYCKENQVLNLFLRFHPIINNNEIIDNVNIAETGDYAIVNLKKIDFPIIKSFEYRHQKSIKKAINSKVKIIISNDEKYLKDFIEIYRNEMINKNANKFYFFDKDFFYNLKNYIKNNYQFFYAIFEGKIISCELVIYSNSYSHSYIGATKYEFRHICSNHLLKKEIIEYFKSKGLQYFFLGGSQSENDGIFKYKSGFSNQKILKNKIGKIIFDKKKDLELRKIFNQKFPNENFKKLQFYEDYFLT
tara:strand:- start:70 stop:1119 length:1050 start_codon:yes stop_codon:yes gene_type:complete